MSIPEPLTIIKKGRVAAIVLNRPQVLNVLDTETLDLLGEALLEVGKDGDTRAVIVMGKGHFCAGADVKVLKDKDREGAEAFSRLGQGVCDRIEKLDKPVIAAVTGYALGGGCELALACDIRIAEEDTKFGLPEINLGLIPGFGGTRRMSRLVGIGKAKELILTGKLIDAREAESIGLVNKVVKIGSVIPEAEELAALLSQKSPWVLGKIKRLINGSGGMREGLQREAEAFASCYESPDYLEGINAFLEKRRPVF